MKLLNSIILDYNSVFCKSKTNGHSNLEVIQNIALRILLFNGILGVTYLLIPSPCIESILCEAVCRVDKYECGSHRNRHANKCRMGFVELYQEGGE